MKKLLLFLLVVVSSCRLGGLSQVNIPEEAYETLEYIEKYNKAPQGYVGGRRFGNYEQLLPKKTQEGRKIHYKEWDIYPKIKGKNRGSHRLVTGSDKRAYYTSDHYNSFTEITLENSPLGKTP